MTIGMDRHKQLLKLCMTLGKSLHLRASVPSSIQQESLFFFSPSLSACVALSIQILTPLVKKHPWVYVKSSECLCIIRMCVEGLRAAPEGRVFICGEEAVGNGQVFNLALRSCVGSWAHLW